MSRNSRFGLIVLTILSLVLAACTTTTTSGTPAATSEVLGSTAVAPGTTEQATVAPLGTAQPQATTPMTGTKAAPAGTSTAKPQGVAECIVGEWKLKDAEGFLNSVLKETVQGAEFSAASGTLTMTINDDNTWTWTADGWSASFKWEGQTAMVTLKADGTSEGKYEITSEPGTGGTAVGTPKPATPKPAGTSSSGTGGTAVGTPKPTGTSTGGTGGTAVGTPKPAGTSTTGSGTMMEGEKIEITGEATESNISVTVTLNGQVLPGITPEQFNFPSGLEGRFMVSCKGDTLELTPVMSGTSTGTTGSESIKPLIFERVEKESMATPVGTAKPSGTSKPSGTGTPKPTP